MNDNLIVKVELLVDTRHKEVVPLTTTSLYTYIAWATQITTLDQLHNDFAHAQLIGKGHRLCVLERLYLSGYLEEAARSYGKYTIRKRKEILVRVVTTGGILEVTDYPGFCLASRPSGLFTRRGKEGGH